MSSKLPDYFRGTLAKMNMVTSVPLSLLLLCLEEISDENFSCPCKLHYNQAIAFLIYFAPAVIVLVLMLFSLRPFKYDYKYDWTKKICCFSEKLNDCGTSQGDANRGTSKSERNEIKEKLCCEKTFIVCLIPSLVWICLWFINGDYLACGDTYWDGNYTRDKELKWCKPNNLSKETTAYEHTRARINLSKILGYSLAIIFSLVAICFVSLDCRKSGKPTCRKIDPETQSHGCQGPGTENQQRTDDAQTGNNETATEEDTLV